MWVCLNEEGMRVWGDVFPEGKVPVCSMSFHRATLGVGKGEQVVLVNWNALSSQQKDAILAKISQRSGVPAQAILSEILKVDLPLRERFTTGVVAAELRFFI